MRYVEFITKGLEETAKVELQTVCDPQNIVTADKRVIFDASEAIPKIKSLRIADDIGIYGGQINDVKDIAEINDFIDQWNLEGVREALKIYRPVADTFSVTVSAAGTPLQPKNIIEAIVTSVRKKYAWVYTERDHTNFDLRVFIDHNTALLAVRLTKESLHNRGYKTISMPGSLRPTVAAAMVQLATEGKKGLQIVDDFCGSGTILCEAKIAGNTISGGDLDHDSVAVTKHNLKNIEPDKNEIVIQDAKRTRWKSASFDCAISNLPWNKQIPVKSITELFEGTVREYARILKPEGTVCMLVTKPELLVKYARKYFPEKEIIQIKIGLLGQNPTLILVK